MAEETTDAGKTSDEETGDAPGQDHEKTEDSVETWKSKFNDVKSSRDKANRQLRELKAQFDELRATISEREQQEAEKSGKTDDVKAHYEKKLTAKETELSELRSRLKKTVVERAVRSTAQEFIRPELLDDFYKLTEEHFSVGTDDDGNEIAVIKGKEYLSLEEFCQEFCAKKPVFAKNTRKPGADVPEKGETKRDEGKPTLESVRKLTTAEQQKVFRKHPDLAREMLRNFVPQN